MERQITDVVIIGGGPVGLFAIFQAGMLGMRVHLFDTLPKLGGQCSALYPQKPIYDIPGHPKILSQDLIDNLIEQARPFHPVYHLDDQVLRLEKTEDVLWKVRSSSGFEIYTKTVLIVAGNGSFGPNRPALDGLEEFEQNDSVLYFLKECEDVRDKNVVIAGGGDSAADWTNLLGNIASKIYLVHRREEFGCLPDSLARIKNLSASGAVEICSSTQVVGIQGRDGALQAVVLRDNEGKERTIPVDKAIFCYGLKMYLGPILNWGLELCKNRITVDFRTCETNLPGVYAAGDIAFYEGKLKLILTGFSEVAMALHHAHKKVFPDKVLRFQYSTDKGVPI
jgi:thioredoxin reductase (NADPH)